MFQSIYKRLRRVFKRYPVKHFKRSGPLRIALVYLSDFEVDNRFCTNRAEMARLVRVFQGLGYSLDVYDCRDMSFSLGFQPKYDLVFGFGKWYRKLKVFQGGKKILYLTEGHPEFSYRNERSRVSAFNLRNDVKVGMVRSGSYYKDVDFELADAVVCLGEEHQSYIAEKLPQTPIYSMNPTALPSAFVKEDFSRKNSVLWFGSRGMVHKGLDLLLEAASKVGCRVYVAGVSLTDVKSLYSDIPGSVEVLGRLDVSGERFGNLLNEVDFAIFPSCSEAVPTSVLTIAKCGLPVIASDKCGTKFNGRINVCKMDTVADVVDVIKVAYSWGETHLRECSKRQMSAGEYTLERFECSFSRIIRQVIDEN